MGELTRELTRGLTRGLTRELTRELTRGPPGTLAAAPPSPLRTHHLHALHSVYGPATKNKVTGTGRTCGKLDLHALRTARCPKLRNPPGFRGCWT